MKRKRYSKDFKARVALEAIKGQKTADELASEHAIHRCAPRKCEARGA